MSGETDLKKLLGALSPKLLDGDFVFCTFIDATYGDRADLVPIASFAEPEGLTLVIPKKKADDHNLGYDSLFRCITLEVHSSLEAVGLTAAVSAKLAEQNISANMIAGFFHDHVFVPSDSAQMALKFLTDLSAH